MRFRKRQLTLASTAVVVVASTMMLFVHRGVVDALLMVLIGAALSGMYLLRCHARAELVYARVNDRRRRPPPRRS